MHFSLLGLLFAIPAVLAQTAGSTTAFGIGVEDLHRSIAFYRDILGLKTGQIFNTTQFDEIILTYPKGAAVVLMKWKVPKNIVNPGVKLVFNVPDVKGMQEKIRAAGFPIVLEAGSAKMKNVTIPTSMAKDPDGYIIELNPTSGFQLS